MHRLCVLALALLAVCRSESNHVEKYPPLHETYCPPLPDSNSGLEQGSTVIDKPGALLDQGTCLTMRERSHYCNYIWKPTGNQAKVRYNRSIRITVGRDSVYRLIQRNRDQNSTNFCFQHFSVSVVYECKFSYIPGCESQIQLLRQCLRFINMPENLIRIVRENKTN